MEGNFIIDLLNQFAIKHPWIPLVLAIYLAAVKFLQGIRDSIDKTPAEDNNFFERLVTILGKTIGYLGGVRPSAPSSAKIVPGETKDAVGVKVE